MEFEKDLDMKLIQNLKAFECHDDNKTDFALIQVMNRAFDVYHKYKLEYEELIKDNKS